MQHRIVAGTQEPEHKEGNRKPDSDRAQKLLRHEHGKTQVRNIIDDIFDAHKYCDTGPVVKKRLSFDDSRYVFGKPRLFENARRRDRISRRNYAAEQYAEPY